jgi:aminoglycoside 6'-N-acetyltransferase
MEEIEFENLKETHFHLIQQWFNKPHVQAFYSLRSWTLEEVHSKLMPYLQGEKQMNCFIIHYNKLPVGYIQSYPIKEHPWENQDLPRDIVQEAAGIDFFIGEQEYLGRGLGCKIILQFLEKHIWPYYRYCLADPDIRNEASVRLLQKSGFVEHKRILAKDALQQNVSLQLFLKTNSDFQPYT